MDETNDAVMVLAARSYLYRAFSGLFGNEPSEETASLLDADLLEQSFEVMGCAGSRHGGCERMVSMLRSGVDFPMMKGLYNALFVGPATPAALPWEAMHVTNNGRLFGPVALSVREFYRAHGCLPHGYPHVSDDALALELDFLAVLSGRALSRWEENGSWTEPLEASLVFEREHLGCWTRRLAQAIHRYREESFYGAVADALVEFVEADISTLCGILD